MSKNHKIIFTDGTEKGDWPVAVVSEQVFPEGVKSEDLKLGLGEDKVVDPIFNYAVQQNLYGRILTLVEATTETHKLKPVKDLFSKEIQEWSNEVYRSAREIVGGGDSSSNIYTR
jgi:hypothetical protein